jgi:DNA-binding IclR family transcriptional regulator
MRQVGIFKSKGFSILNTLSRFGLVDKDPQTKNYYLGPNLIFLSRHVLDNMEYPETVAPFLDSLSKNTSGTAVFGLIRGSDVFVVAKREGNQCIGFTLGLGARFHISLGAPGKAITAWMSEMEREKILAKKKLPFYGDPSRMDMKRLGEKIDRCRDLGFAQDLGEVTAGINIQALDNRASSSPCKKRCPYHLLNRRTVLSPHRAALIQILDVSNYDLV